MGHYNIAVDLSYVDIFSDRYSWNFIFVLFQIRKIEMVFAFFSFFILFGAFMEPAISSANKADIEAQEELNEFCEYHHVSSKSYGRTEKTLDIDIEFMRVTWQHSKAECVLGSTFGFYGNTAWADGGCRAEFRFCSIPNPGCIRYGTRGKDLVGNTILGRERNECLTGDGRINVYAECRDAECVCKKGRLGDCDDHHICSCAPISFLPFSNLESNPEFYYELLHGR